MLIETTHKDGICWVYLKNEKKLNALSSALIDELHSAVKEINSNQEIKVCVITGGEKCFSAGVDIKEMQFLSSDETENFINHKWRSVAEIKVPVIAAVTGYALGGGFELALMADIIIADETAVFGFPEVKLGLMPGNGGTQKLPYLVGKSIASDLMMTGAFINAEKALELKIISRVVEKGSLLQEVSALADIISQQSMASLKNIKRAISFAENQLLHPGILKEQKIFNEMLGTAHF